MSDDYAEPITEEWLQSIPGYHHNGFDIGEGRLLIYVKPEGGCWSCSIEIEHAAPWCRHEIDLPLPENRGDLRSLLKALGVSQ